MPLEVRQLVVRSSVEPAPSSGMESGELDRRDEILRREILDECRRRIEALRDDPKER